MHAVTRLLVAALAVSAGSCRPADAPPAVVPVVVSIPPQAGFVKRIGGAHVSVQVLVKPGQSPHAYEPTPRQMAGLAKARAYFTIGVPFEAPLLERIKGSLPSLRIIDSAAGIRRRMMAGHHHDEGDADHEEHPSAGLGAGEHEGEAEPDPHVWLSPACMRIIARNTAAGLIEVDPAHAAEYEANLAALLADVDAVDAQVAEVLAPYRGQSFYVFHPAFGYLADAYGLRQVAVEEEGKSPGPRRLAELTHSAGDDGVRIIFVQPQFDRKSARVVAESIGGAVVPLDPLAEDVLGNLSSMAEEVARALGVP
jgi:zinc transport system substrate-binding protein